MIQGVLFDMDGVIFDTERVHENVNDQVSREMGYIFPKEMLQKTYGANKDYLNELLLEYMGPEFNREIFYAESHKRVIKTLNDMGMPLKPGIVELLKYLKKNKLKIAVASSSTVEVIQHYLSMSNLIGYFEVIIGGNMVSYSKPNPEIFIKAAESLNLRPEYCIAIEDSFNGIKSASAAGCHTLMVPDMVQPTEEILQLCHQVFSSLEDIPSYIDLINT